MNGMCHRTLPVMSIHHNPNGLFQDFHSITVTYSLDGHILTNCSQSVKHKLIHAVPLSLSIGNNSVTYTSIYTNIFSHLSSFMEGRHNRESTCLIDNLLPRKYNILKKKYYFHLCSIFSIKCVFLLG